MGEGECSIDSQRELMMYAQKLHSVNILSCLYSGKDCEIEAWMQVLDFIKIGNYKEEFGLLFECTTVDADIHSFIDLLEQEPFDQNSLKRYGLKNEDVVEALKQVFG